MFGQLGLQANSAPRPQNTLTDTESLRKCNELDQVRLHRLLRTESISSETCSKTFAEVSAISDRDGATHTGLGTRLRDLTGLTESE